MTPEVIEINGWRDLVERQRPYRIFRGQSDAEWPLRTSLERACLANDGSLKDAGERERRLLLQFKRRYHEFSDNSPADDDDLRWFALMQHHGTPTRLIDWTYSLLVAIYFAVENAETESAVWEINTDLLSKASREYLESRDVPSREEHDLSLAVHLGNVSPEDGRNRFRDWMLTNKFRFAKLAVPYIKDRRLTAQQGVFMAPGDVTASFMGNLGDLPDAPRMVVKYVIRPRFRDEFLYQLYAANVGRFSLFPDLDGFAASLRVFDPAVWPLRASDGPVYNER